MRVDSSFPLPPLRRRTVLQIALPIAVAVILALIVIGDIERRATMSRWSDGLALQLDHRASQIERQLTGLRQAALFLAGVPPVPGIARANANDGYDPIERTATALWKHRLDMIFDAYQAYNPLVLQLRYVGVENGGVDLVRWDRQPERPSEHFADAGNYMQACRQLKAGDTYLSDIAFDSAPQGALNSRLPVIHVVTPVYGPNGNLFGAIIIKAAADSLFKAVSSDLPAGSSAYLLNTEGGYLLSPFGISASGPALPERRWQDDFFRLSENAMQRGLADYRQNGALVHVISRDIHYDERDPRRHLTFALVVPDAVIAASVAQEWKVDVLAMLLGMGLIGTFLYSYWRQRYKVIIEQSRLAAIVSSADDAIIAKTPGGVVTDWNPKAEAMFGYGRQEAVGHTLLSLIVPPEQAKEEEAIMECIARGESVPPFETVRRHRSGSQLSVAITASPIRAAGDLVIGASETLRDITRQKEADQLLRKTQGQLKTFVQEAPIAMAMFDREMKYLSYSQRWLALYGRGHATLAGRCHYDIHPDLPEHWKAVHRQGMDGIAVRNDRDLWVMADGTKRWIRWAVLPWINEVGEIGGIVISAEEITASIRAEEELRIAAVAFQTRDGLIVTDAKGVILRVNRAFTEVTGYSPGDVVGQTPAVWKSGRHDAAFYRTMWEGISRDGHWEGKIWNRRKDGGIFPEWLSISSVCDEQGAVTHYVATFADIREPKEAERRILDLAFYDQLTGLPNRRLMADRLQHAAAAAARSHHFGALLLFDIDHFKSINDTRGHDVGDELLVTIAKRLRTSLRQIDTAARLGGDEFVVVLNDLHENQVTAATLAESVANKILDAIHEPMTLKGEVHQVTCSMGVSLFGANGPEMEALLKQADIALYQAKDAGRNSVRYYNSSMQAAVDARAELEFSLRRSIANEEFMLQYQPQVDASGGLVGAEALLRWCPGEGEVLPPDRFIVVAEDSGLIVPIGKWVLETACRQIRAWEDIPSMRNVQVAVNVSARQFRQADFVDVLRRTLEHTGANPARLKLELTESVLLQDIDSVALKMQELRALGVGFSIDDFGTGYSSLAYLKGLPLDELKIAQAFVHQIERDPSDRAIVQAIISLGRSMNLGLIAEGVESKGQRDILAGQGCCTFQGFLFGRPAPASTIEAMAPAEHAAASPK